MQLTGIHHLTAVTARAAENVAFYTGTLGLRLVKKTVNQDDVSAYHLFYADGLASPGTDITFFDWPAPRERRGSNSITRTHLRVPGEGAVAWWHARLREAGIVRRPSPPSATGASPSISRIRRASASPSSTTAAAGRSTPGTEPRCRPSYQIRGLGPIRLAVPDPDRTAAVLTEVLGMRRDRAFETRDGPVRGLRHGAGRPGRRGSAPGRPPPRRPGRARARSTTSPSASRMRITTPGPSG